MVLCTGGEGRGKGGRGRSLRDWGGRWDEGSRWGVRAVFFLMGFDSALCLGGCGVVHHHHHHHHHHRAFLVGCDEYGLGFPLA